MGYHHTRRRIYEAAPFAEPSRALPGEGSAEGAASKEHIINKK